MVRKPCCEKVGLKKGPWTIEEDHKLVNFILKNGIQCWRNIPKLAGLLRCGKSCRLRWINYLRPGVKRGALSELEENQIIELHSRLGNRWSKIASHFPGRTDNEIKNLWNTRIKKRLKLLGLDPVTHKPIELKGRTESISDMLPPKDGEEMLEIASQKNHSPKYGPEANEKVYEVEISSDATTGIFSNQSEMLWGNLDVELGMNQESSSSSNTTYSLDDSMKLSASDSSSSIQEDSQPWIDIVDSILSWDDFVPLEDEFSL